MKKKHNFDCCIYKSILNNQDTDGFCTCGYGSQEARKMNFNEVASKERLEELKNRIKKGK